jgi:3-oxoacyl-[acyl-carrier-protein] synthase III
MGARIESVATARGGRLPFTSGALHLSDAAARACLERAHRSARDLDLLVNAGLYKDGNLAEPALASIIQEDVGANPGHPPIPEHHGTFSFDVLNGGCGFLTAAHLVDAFVGPGTAQHGMVVAADADPAPRQTRSFPFPPVGGAALFGHCAADEGFERFDFKTFPEHIGLFEARVEYDASAVGLLDHRGRSVLTIREDPSFGARCAERAASVASGFLDAARLLPKDVDLLIASQYPAPFAAEVAGALGIPRDRVPILRAELAGAHTAGPIAALEAAMESGRFAAAKRVLFVTAGAGITIAVALYRTASN